MSDSHHVKHLKRALAVVRTPEGSVAGMAVALRTADRAVLAVPFGLAEPLADGRLRLVRHPTPPLLARDAAAGLALLSLPPELGLEPLRSLAVAPEEDGVALLATGSGLTVDVGAGHERHLWITRGCRLAGRLHAFADGERLPEFRYLLDLPAGALPPGSPVLRTADGALLGMLAEDPAPAAELTLCLPSREAAALVQSLGPEPSSDQLA